jgi:hypothetical protein
LKREVGEYHFSVLCTEPFSAHKVS